MRERSILPVAELFHLVPLSAMVALGLNDHWLKGAGLLPVWLTAKLSDFAGVVFFPLLLTALGDSVAWAVGRLSHRLGSTFAPDSALRPWKIAVTCGITALIMAAIKLSPLAASVYEVAMGALGVHSRVVVDPSDLLALAALPLPILVARRRLAAQGA